MKTIKPAIIGAVALSLASAIHSYAVVGQALNVQGTNLVLSWPSQGYEQYMIQYRSTLDPSTPWEQLTNAYPANSTNRTTFTIYGVVPPPLAGGGSFAANRARSALTLLTSGPLAIPANGSGSPVPLCLFPPDMNMSGYVILDPLSGESVNGVPFTAGALSLNTPAFDNPQPLDGGGSGGSMQEPQTGFYRVWHIPNFPASITNYMFDGPIFVPVDFADYRDRVDYIEVLIDGELMPYADYMSLFYNGQTNWGMGIYFDRLTNGTHQIQLVSTVHINDDIDKNAIYLVLSNLTRTVTVANDVTFPNWNDFIQGDTYTFNAQIANPNTDWQIDIYDAWNNYVNSGYGHTTDGSVSWTWDLTDYWGNSRDDFDGDPYFYCYISFNTGSSGGLSPQAQTTKPMPSLVKGYPNQGEWLISFQDRWFADAPGYPSDCQGKYMDAMQYTYSGPLLVNDTALWYPIRFGTNAYAQAERDYDWTNLPAMLGNLYIRNFYYHGHGGATSLGTDRHTLDTNGLVNGGALTSRYSQAQMFSWRVAQKTRYNRYRFVFLDGCNTADGDWPNAFNVSKTNHALSFYQNDPKHRRPSVFVGWTGISGGEGSVYHWLDFEQNWMGIWANDYRHPSIKESLEWSNDYYNWLGAGEFDSKLRIYGYQDMKVEDYNHKGDWRWP
jgi:hypothetical protein